MILKLLPLLLMVLFIGCEDLLDTEATSMTIESVSLEKMPFLDASNLNWDELSGPDVYIRFEESNVSGGIETGTNQDISPDDLPVSWTTSPTFTLDDFDNDLEVFVYDADVLSDDLIEAVSFEFDPIETPDTWTLDLNDDLQLTIEVTYEY